MSAYLFYSPKFRPLSISGAILPGAKLTFYKTGTTTKADTYSDSTLETENTNPVVADSAGEFDAIYLDPAITYRAILTDEDDVELWDIDPLAPARDYPPGTILMFYGTETELEAAYPPAQWQQLNGNNGAPDIRDRFPIGKSSTIDVGDTGGSIAAATTSAAGGHDHGGETGGHSLTEAELAAHSHGGWYNTGFERGISQSVPGSTDRSGVVIPGKTRNDSAVLDSTGNSAEATDGLTNDAGDGDAHKHSITEVDDHTHTVTVTPPYLGLFFIMRRSD